MQSNESSSSNMETSKHVLISNKGSTELIVESKADILAKVNSSNTIKQSTIIDPSDIIKWKTTVATLLNIPLNDNWDIVDIDDSLLMIHYSDDADMAEYGHIRGIVIDVKLKVIVADSYGYTPTAVTDALWSDKNGNITLKDNDGNTHQFKQSGAMFRHGLEGVMIRVFKWQGKTYLSSHRRFDLSRSKWGDSLAFKQIYLDLGGPTTMFGESEQYSPYVHFFLAEHTSLLHVTKNQVNNGFLYYLGYRCMWDSCPTDKCPFKTTHIDGSIINPSVWHNDPRPNAGYIHSQPRPPLNMRNTLPTLKEEINMVTNNLTQPCIQLGTLSVPQANTALRYGYMVPSADEHIDYRLRTGEFVVLYKKDGTLLRIESKAYNWRARVSNDNPNRSHQWYTLLKFAKNSNATEFRKMFPPMRQYNINAIKDVLKQGPIFIWNNEGLSKDSFETIKTFHQRLYNVWACLLVASPYNRQIGIVNFYDDYFINNESFIKWSYKYRQEILLQKPEEVDNHLLIYSDRLRDVIARASNAKSFKIKMRQILKDEFGESLYRLIREMKRHKRWSTLDNKVSETSVKTDDKLKLTTSIPITDN